MPSLLAELDVEAEARASGRSGLARLRDDVLANIKRVCATRRGSAAIADDYGADDVRRLFVGSEAAIDGFRVRLAASLARHEPRLTNLRLGFLPSDGLVLRFTLSGELELRGVRSPASFEVALGPHGIVSAR